MGKKTFRYGFKAECENYAKDYREELGLQSHEALCPHRLAEHLAIPVYGIKTNSALSSDVIDHWAATRSGEFSGLVMQLGSFKQIVHNDFHHERRQNSHLFHELAHIILGHDLAVPFKENGERDYDKIVEDEAKWLGAALHMPKVAAVYSIKSGMLWEDIQAYYGISRDMYDFRIRVTDTMGLIRNYRAKTMKAAAE